MFDAKRKKSQVRKPCGAEHRETASLWRPYFCSTSFSWRDIFSQVKVEIQRKNFSKKNRTHLRGYLQKAKEDQKGFSLIILLVLLPFLVTSLVFLGVLGLSLKHYHKGHRMCRQQLLETQDQLALVIERLVRLNPKSRTLRWKRMQAEKKWRLAQSTGRPAVIAAAAAHLSYVTAQQVRHQARQQKWIFMGRRIQWIGPSEFSSEVRREFKGKVRHLMPPKYPLALQAKPLKSLTPDYQPLPHFEERQKASAHWSLSVRAILPPFLSTFVNAQRKIIFQCSATIFRKEKKWIPSLSADKPSWSL